MKIGVRVWRVTWFRKTAPPPSAQYPRGSFLALAAQRESGGLPQGPPRLAAGEGGAAVEGGAVAEGGPAGRQLL